MDKWTTVADDATIEKTVVALKENGIDAIVVENGEEAKKKVLELLPQDARVMDMTSITLQTTGIMKAIRESERYDALHPKALKLDRVKDEREIAQIRSIPDWAIGSIHAVTTEGQVLIASNTGSQMPAYVFGAKHVIWVVGAQKIVQNLDDGFKRIYEHSYPLEKERAKNAYGITSNVSKILIINKETRPGRILMVLVKEALGF